MTDNPSHRTKPRAATADERHKLLRLYHQKDHPAFLQAAKSLATKYPADAFSWKAYASALSSASPDDTAVAALRKALTLKPRDPQLLFNLGTVLQGLQRLEQAQAAFAQAIVAQPDNHSLYNSLGVVEQSLGNVAKAEPAYRRAIRLKPDEFKSHYNLAELLRQTGRLTEAIAEYQKAISLDPRRSLAYFKIAIVLRDLGRLDEATAAFLRGLAIDPRDATNCSNFIFMLTYTNHLDPLARLQHARGYDLAALSTDERRQANARRMRFRRPNPQCLRIGLLSAELGRHSVAYFLLPWLQARQRERIHLSIFSVAQRPEPEYTYFRSLADEWHEIIDLDDAAATEFIRQQEIDILIETSGHTENNRLGILARRAAPIQCHYLGFMGTTGLTEMDYFIADTTLAPESLDQQFSERLWRLNGPWMVYQPFEEAPSNLWEPPADGSIRLGSFNDLNKVRDECIALWGAVLRALPQARLFLKHAKSASPDIRARILEQLESEGVRPERVLFETWQPDWQAHMRLYHRLDIALDTVPFTSVTTAFEALWMGVPLITLEGDSLSGRMATSILTWLGRSDWVARSTDEYVAKVVALAEDAVQLKNWHSGLRDMMRASPLCDGDRLAGSLEKAFAEMVGAWHKDHQALDALDARGENRQPLPTAPLAGERRDARSEPPC